MGRYIGFGCVVPVLFVAHNVIAATTYALSFDLNERGVMIVEVQRPTDAAGTSLVYHGSRIGTGVKSQIENVECDGNPLRHSLTRDEWLVPAGCKSVRWRIQFGSPGAGDSTTQRSVASTDNSFRLFSTASSLASLSDADQDSTLSVPKLKDGFTIPKPRVDGTLSIPPLKDPPLFVLLGSKPAAVSESHDLTVRYFIDDPSQGAYVAPLRTVARGLRWLASQMPKAEHVDFNYAWLGVPADAVSMGGATGTGLMMVNYARSGTSDRMRAAVTALAPLIEGTHHLAQPFGSRNGWAEESLATYFGLRALEHASPHDGDASALMTKFVADSAHFPLGLVEAQRHVAVGDGAAYPTYFTKGVAFWSAVDQAMRNLNGSGLDKNSKVLWTMRFQPDGQPPANFASALGIPEEQWLTLRHRFLD